MTSFSSDVKKFRTDCSDILHFFDNATTGHQEMLSGRMVLRTKYYVSFLKLLKSSRTKFMHGRLQMSSLGVLQLFMSSTLGKIRIQVRDHYLHCWSDLHFNFHDFKSNEQFGKLIIIWLTTSLGIQSRKQCFCSLLWNRCRSHNEST